MKNTFLAIIVENLSSDAGSWRWKLGIKAPKLDFFSAK
jgi:hypothetical protein